MLLLLLLLWVVTIVIRAPVWVLLLQGLRIFLENLSPHDSDHLESAAVG